MRSSRRKAATRIVVGLTIALCAAGAAAIALRFPNDGLHFVDLAGELGGFQWSATQVRVRGAVEPSGSGIRAMLYIEADGVAAHDEGFERAGENLEIAGTVEIFDKPGAELDVRVDLSIAGGELLVDRYYLNLKAYPVELAARLRLAPAGGTNTARWVTFSDARVTVGGIGTATGEGRVALTDGRVEADTKLQLHGLASLYNVVASDPIEDRRYRLGSGGTMTANLTFRRDANADFTFTGGIVLRDGTLFAADPEFRLSGVQVDLPVAFGTGELATTQAQGRASIAGGTLLGGTIGGTSLEVEVGPNSIRLVRPLRVPIFDGAITVRDFDSTELAVESRRMSLGVDLVDVDLEQLTRSLGLPRVTGTISASLPEIEVGSGRLRSEGELVADVFGGQVRARKLRGDRLRSSVPTFGFDLDFEDISLAELTRTLSFGYVSGIARGGVRDLEFVSWGPVEFSAWLETYPVRGVPQRVSVDAIRQISIVGGGSSDPFSASIMRLFDEYRYRKLGFRCHLENDVFELDGIEEHDGDHYLVVGGNIPPRVNVVSHVRKIAFSDMMSRIESAAP